ncbi:hypothetical protein CIL05_06780 [Virgibacillus profundi]|uniref:Uncharacterized protein n=1 Tax=Virgibacillus profundi TaxID=2024555 RepID=A0A2A2IFS3_9BACI|nr:hypothetical protein [Virgibacillus profundi]PAV30166.1 hypothetical protein CIL05_06780 [Virgibacillus profundi]PXY54338.1 hypothetical protein CIT14_06865 [Virgibacillus profundi]
MNKTYIIDVAEAIVTRKSDKHTVFMGTGSTAGFNITGESETQRGGIGVKPVYRYNHSKTVELNITDVVFDLNYLAMTQGVEIADGSATVKKTETGLIVQSDVDALSVTLTGTPVDSTAILINGGESVEVAVATDSVSVPEGFAEEGDKVTAIYKEEAQGKVIDIDASKFSESYEIQYRTIEYDTKTNTVVNDIYFIFDNVVFNTEFEMALEAGTPLTPALTMEALTGDDEDKIGRVVQVPRTV